MSKIVKTMKLYLHTDEETDRQFMESAVRYASACDYISEYVFDHDFILDFVKLHDSLYYEIRKQFGLKSQMTISSFKTVTARYKAVKKQLSKNPYKYKDENGDMQFIPRTLEWLQKPIRFRRPQIDLVRNRDYSFVGDQISINTLGKRIKVDYEVSEYFEPYFSDSWTFGTAKLVSLKGKWYLHIPITKDDKNDMLVSRPKHVVGIDRGLRFPITAYDETGKCSFVNGEEIMAKRERFLRTRSELQSKGTKSAKRALKRISGREKRWMIDVNHQLSKALVSEYGEKTLFVLEDLTGVSFSEENLSKKNADGRSEL